MTKKDVKFKKVPINIQKAVEVMCRRVERGIYLNEDCFVTFGGKELISMDKILSTLYEEYLIHQNDPRYIGLGFTELGEKSGLDKRTITRNVIWLMPLFINIKTYGRAEISKGYHKCRKTKLNDNGVLLVEEMIRRRKRAKNV